MNAPNELSSLLKENKSASSSYLSFEKEIPSFILFSVFPIIVLKSNDPNKL